MIQKLGFQMSRSLENISRAGEYMKDLGEFVVLSEAEDALTEPDACPIQIDSLEFRNVRFCYPSSNEYILDGLSFNLKAGRHYAFVGKNGAGKFVDIGTHDELIARPGQYAKMWEAQAQWYERA